MEEPAKMRLQGVFDEATEIDDDGWKYFRAAHRRYLRLTTPFEEGTPGVVDDNVVEGSMMEPVTDPTKLLE